MFLVQRIFTRLDAAVLFYTPTAEFKAHAKATFVDTQKILSDTSSITEDKLKLVISTMWKDEASWNEYTSDPVVVTHITTRNAYNTEHNITDERLTSQV